MYKKRFKKILSTLFKPLFKKPLFKKNPYQPPPLNWLAFTLLTANSRSSTCFLRGNKEGETAQVSLK